MSNGSHERELWGIVNGIETVPEEENANQCAKFLVRKDRALATIVLAVDPTLLYLNRDTEVNLVIVRKKLENQFQKKT